MLRIVGVQKSSQPNREFVLLQNHGHLRVNLRGYGLIAESAIDGQTPAAFHIFQEEESIHASTYVMLISGSGVSQWGRSKDGSLVFYCYMNRAVSAWNDSEGPISVLAPQHRYCPRAQESAPTTYGNSSVAKVL